MESPATDNVPVAVTLATEVRSPETSKFPVSEFLPATGEEVPELIVPYVKKFPVDCNVDDANTSPLLLIAKRLVPEEFCMRKRFATWLAAARIASGITDVDVASIVTCVFAKGVVVPNDDGVEVPLTACANRAKGAAPMRWRGDNV